MFGDDKDCANWNMESLNNVVHVHAAKGQDKVLGMLIKVFIGIFERDMSRALPHKRNNKLKEIKSDHDGRLHLGGSIRT